MIRGLGVRAANHARREYLPTYVGVRLLLSSCPSLNLDSWLHDFAKTRCQLKRAARYNKYEILKSFKDGDPSYRVCFSPSPSSLVTESFILAILSELPEFSVPENVYSYRWPNHNSGQTYEFFLNGYQDKQEKIRHLLAFRPSEYTVLITDIERFYPSTNTSALQSRFADRLSRSLLPKELISGILSASHDLFSIPGCDGIPIGSAFGHIFGHLALDSVDREMTALVGDGYLRYVDDITLVVPNHEIDDAQSYLEETVSKAGYRLNSDKTFRINGREWRDSLIDNTLMGEFSELRYDAITYLMLNPDNFDRMNSAFRESGLNLPVSVFRQVAEYGRFKKWAIRINYLRRKLSNPPDIKEIVRKAIRLRSRLLDYYYGIVQTSAPGGTPLDEKLDIQRLRWCINRLVYLSPVEQFPELLERLPNADALVPYKSLLRGIYERSVDEIILFPGPLVAAFAQLWTQIYPNVVFDAPYSTTLQGPKLHSAAVLAAYRIMPQAAFASTQYNSRSDELLMRFSTFQVPKHRELTDLSYIDEVRTLMLGASESFGRNALETRFDDAEVSYMDALALGIGGYS